MLRNAGASSSSRNALPDDTPVQKEPAQMEEQLSFTLVAKAAKVTAETGPFLKEEMVPTPNKKDRKECLLMKASGWHTTPKVTAEIGQIVILRDKQRELQ